MVRVSARLLTLTLMMSGTAALSSPHPAGAASKVSCTRMTLISTTVTGNAGTSKSKLSGCTPASATGGSAIIVIHAVISPYKASATITWAAKKGTTSARRHGQGARQRQVPGSLSPRGHHPDDRRRYRCRGQGDPEGLRRKDVVLHRRPQADAGARHEGDLLSRPLCRTEVHVAA